MLLEYNETKIEQREDGYVNLTQMAKANNVKTNNWSQLKETSAYIQELETITGIPAIQLLHR